MSDTAKFRRDRQEEQFKASILSPQGGKTILATARSIPSESKRDPKKNPVKQIFKPFHQSAHRVSP